MQLFRDDNYYPVDVNNNERNVRVKDNSNDWKYILSFIGIIFLLIIIVIFKLLFPTSDNKENKKQNSNINSELKQEEYEKVIQNMNETEDGFKEEIIFYTAVENKQVVIKASGSRMYLISCKDNVLADYEYIEIGIQTYNNLEINDNIKVIRTIYYDKNKQKLYYDDLVEKINKF